MNTKTFWIRMILSILLLASCASPQTLPGSIPTLTEVADEETVTLNSLKQVDGYPLYVMYYSGTYKRSTTSYEPSLPADAMLLPAREDCSANWGCSLFSALGDEKNRLFGRNFDWQFSPALLLFTDPLDGYASVSMVDMEYLGFGGDKDRNLADLPLDERRALLNAPFIPFDGMNEKGLAIGMAAVPTEDMPYDSQKQTIGELGVMREILDHAATVDEAIEILNRYNIDMEEVPIHYLLASASGESALVEFYQGEMVIFRNESPWQVATNFLFASTNGNADGLCWRYDLIKRRLKEQEGRLSFPDALHLLANVSQENTQWSIIYHLTSGNIQVVMGRGYSNAVHTFNLEERAR